MRNLVYFIYFGGNAYETPNILGLFFLDISKLYPY